MFGDRTDYPFLAEARIELVVDCRLALIENARFDRAVVRLAIHYMEKHTDYDEDSDPTQEKKTHKTLLPVLSRSSSCRHTNRLAKDAIECG